MKDFIKTYKNPNKDKINYDLINRKYDKPLIEYIVDSAKSLEVLKNIEFMPPKPPKAIGYVEKIGNLLPIYRMRYLEVDPFVGTIKRYKSVRDYPRNPNEIIPLIGVTSCIKEYSDNESNITNINLQNKRKI